MFYAKLTKHARLGE